MSDSTEYVYIWSPIPTQLVEYIRKWKGQILPVQHSIWSLLDHVESIFLWYVHTCWYFIYSFPMMPLPVAKPLSDTSKFTKGNDKHNKCHIDAEDKTECASINSTSSPAVPQPSLGKWVCYRKSKCIVQNKVCLTLVWLLELQLEYRLYTVATNYSFWKPHLPVIEELVCNKHMTTQECKLY